MNAQHPPSPHQNRPLAEASDQAVAAAVLHQAEAVVPHPAAVGAPATTFLIISSAQFISVLFSKSSRPAQLWSLTVSMQIRLHVLDV